VRNDAPPGVSDCSTAHRVERNGERIELAACSSHAGSSASGKYAPAANANRAPLIPTKPLPRRKVSIPAALTSPSSA